MELSFSFPLYGHDFFALCVMKMDKHRVADIDIRLPKAETEQSPSEH